MKKYRFNLIYLILILIFTLVGCSVNQVEEVSAPVSVNSNTDKTITHMTNGVIQSNQKIAVRFEEEQVSAENLKKRYPAEDVFSFTPEIEGEYYWENTRTVIFEPVSPLLDRNKYISTINLNNLFPNLSGVTPEEEVFEFETQGFYVQNYQGELLLADEESKELFLRGEFTLSEKIDPDKVKEAVRLNDKNIEYNLEIETGFNNTYSFKSDLIKRTDSHKQLVFKIDKDKLNMVEGFQKEYNISPKGMLEVNRIEEISNGNYSDIRVIFSDTLDSDEDYMPYVSVKPNLDINIDVEGRNMYIKGKFEAGQKYKVSFLSGLKSKLGKEFVTTKDYQIDVNISDILPKVEFVNDGQFLTSSKNKKILFRTMNVNRVQVRVKKVQEDSLISFLNENKYDYHEYNEYGFKRKAEILDSKILKIGEDRNRWIQSELDLSNVIDDSKGMYIVYLEYKPEDALYFPEDWSEYRIRNFARDSGQKYKHLILSDLGITAKKNSDNIHVFVTDVLKTGPIDNARVRVTDSGGSEIDSAYTDKDGYCVIKNRNDARYIEVRKRYQYSVLELRRTRLDYSLFSTGGRDSRSGIKTFIYTDRGVYRPGDKINLSVIARNSENTFPEDHPIRLKLYNPRNKLVSEETKKESKDGFYSFELETEDTALTGNWEARLEVAGEPFYKTIKIEEVVPYKIKVDIESEKEEFGIDDEIIDFTVVSEYLFGSPAAGLESSTVIKIQPYNKSYNRFNNFMFGNESMDFETRESHTIVQNLDDEGKTAISWDMPEINKVPSALNLKIDTKVLQKGGRQVPETAVFPIKVYDRYVGIKKLNNYYTEIGNKVKFDIVLVSDDGEYVADKTLKYKLYKMRRYWWWDYGSRSEFRKHYKSDEDTVLVRQGELTTENGVVTLEHMLDDYGEMLIEVEDPEGGHTAGYFFRSSWWGGSSSEDSPNVIDIKTNKDKYLPGDTANVILNTPEKGRVLLTVEKSDKIIYQTWQEIDGPNTEIPVSITEEFIPNAYIYASVFQPYDELNNDMPLRMYGVMPIQVEKEDAELEFSIDTAEKVEPNRKFDVKIKANKQAQFTVAVVDEGLLAITDFETPDPLKYFFAKERLDIRTYDMYGDIIGLNTGYIYNHFSVGGGMTEDEPSYREKQNQSDKTERFKPVALFSGPVETDSNGEAVVSFKMPNYIGKVRVMVVGASKGSYGSAEKDITVRSPLMIMPTLPRVLGPEDKIKVPVTVFAMEDDIEKVNINIDAEGPVSVVGEKEKLVEFDGKTERDVFFEVAAADAVGASKITISANSENYNASKIIDLAVRAYNPYTYLSEDKVIKSESVASFEVPKEGLENTTMTQLTLSDRKGLSINHRLKWLIRYPYGCIEQTTSSVFPQLFLDGLFDLSNKQREDIIKNVNAGIERLRKFQLDNGAFSYWPNGSSPSYWGTNYAGHFLLEAKSRGYNIPDDMFNNWLSYQKERSQENSSRMLTRAYRLYLLSMADSPNLNAMNYMRESKLDEMNNIAEFYLAAAYRYAGYEDIASAMLSDLDIKVEDYNEFSGTYGSGLRDKAIILEVLTLFEKYDRGLELYNQIADEISSDTWLSTQTTAYCLMAASKYVTEFDDSSNISSGYVILPGQENIDFELDTTIKRIPLENSYGEEIKVVNQSAKPIFVSLEWEGIPLEDNVKTEDNNLFLTVDWLDEDGNEIDPTVVKQGTTFWGHFMVDKEIRREIDEIALVQILPSGWEIENIRLLNSDLPSWMNDYRLDKEEYLDIRDDRIMWFFDMERYRSEYDFVVKLNAVTVGEFYLPPTVVEAMYNNRYKATKAGKKVRVISR
ncbi:MAG: alpha-2-macroglobulin family protein [Bacillota bacterium]